MKRWIKSVLLAAALFSLLGLRTVVSVPLAAPAPSAAPGAATAPAPVPLADDAYPPPLLLV